MFDLKDNQGDPIDLGSEHLWVIMNGRRTSVLIDPLTGNAYHAKNKKLAELIAKDCRERLNLKGTFVLPFYQAIKIIAAIDGVDLKPPFTTKSIIEQLEHGFKTGANKDRKKSIKLKNQHSRLTDNDRYQL